MTEPSPGRRRLLVGGAGLLGVAAAAGLGALLGVPDPVERARQLVSGCSAASGPGGRGRRVVSLSTGVGSGVYHALGTALATQEQNSDCSVTIEVDSSSGSLANVSRLGGGTTALALCAGDVALLALTGQPPLTAPVPLVALARVYDDLLHLLVRADSGITAPEQLAGRPVAVGSPGSGTQLVARRLLALVGIEVRALEVDLDQALAALQQRQVAAVFWSGGLPTSAVTALARRLPVALLPLADHAAGLRARHGAAYRPATIPADTYPGVGPTHTLALTNLLVCRPELSGEVIRPVLETLFDRSEAIAAQVPAAAALDPRAAIATAPIPLHPVAADFFRARKP